MKLKDILTDFKTYIVLFLFIIGLGIGTSGLAKLPEKVAIVEEKANKTKDEVKELATTIDKYITEQRIIREEENKREDLMLKLISAIKEDK